MSDAIKTLSLVLRSQDRDGMVNIQTWPLLLSEEEIEELLAIESVYDDAQSCDREGTLIYPIEMALMLETVLLSRVRRQPFFTPILDKLREHREDRRGNWQLHVIEREDDSYIEDLVTGNLPPFDYEAPSTFRHPVPNCQRLLPLAIEEIEEALANLS